MPRAMRRLLAAALLLTASCDPFYLEADVVDLCQRLPGQRFEVPSEVRAQLEQLDPEARRLSLERTFVYDLRLEFPAELQPLMSTRFMLTSVRVTAVEGSAPLRFVDQARLTLLPGEASGLEPQVLEFTRVDPDPQAISWSFAPFDLSQYLRLDTLAYEVLLEGTLPTDPVVVDVELCASARVRLEYL